MDVKTAVYMNISNKRFAIFKFDQFYYRRETNYTAALPFMPNSLIPLGILGFTKPFVSILYF